MSEFKNSNLITPQQARELVAEHVRPLDTSRCPLDKAASYVPAEDIVAQSAYPWFSFSAMDGYAAASSDLTQATENTPVKLPVAGEIRAGDTAERILETGTTLRIMTGAALPEGADAVVMKEVVTEDGGLAVFRAPVAAWTAVNRAGEEIEPGRVLVDRGKRLTPPSLGLLVAMGISELTVHARPRVAVIATGDELVPPGGERAHGQVFNSISPLLAAALVGWGAAGVKLRRCGDDQSRLLAEIRSALAAAEIVLTVGGVSVGDYDFTVPAMAGAGIEKIFHGVSQKPGKPLFFGLADNGKCAFGLPGNPASALVCAALYVRCALEVMSGVAEPEPRVVRVLTRGKLVNSTKRTQFVRVVTSVREDGALECRTAGEQGSYMLSSFAVSNGLAELPPGPMSVGLGETVAVYPLGW